MAKVEFRAVSKSFGENLIVPELNLAIDSGEFVALVGPSGCGKSTCLRMLAGLEDPSRGRIFIDERDVTDVSPRDRGVSMVFQSYALYPHMTVAQNLAFPLKMARGLSSEQIASRVRETADMLDLGELLARKPAQLSGGQKQRVAMGRALVRKPRVLLFDEPLSNLDAQLRVRVRSEIASLHKRLGATIVYVTHDQIEAMTLADRIAILNKGSLEQFGAPLDVYSQPRSRFVASFIGTPPMNFLPAAESSPPKAQVVGFRPEATSFSSTAGMLKLGNGRVSLVEPLGATTHIHVRIGADTVVVEIRGYQPRALDENCDIYARTDSLFHFDSTGLRV